MTVVDLLSHDEGLEAIQNIQCDLTVDQDAVFRQMVTAVTVLIEQRTGPVVQRSTTDTFDGTGGYKGYAGWGGRVTLPLKSRPLSITTVVESGTTLASTDYVLDPDVGFLYRRSGEFDTTWAWGRRNIVVTYMRGRVNDSGVAITTTLLVPPTFKIATGITLRHLWSGQKGMSSGTFGGDMGYAGPAPWALPKQAIDILRGELLLPGIA